ncbi:MAG: hypothetical protein L0Y72_02985 [Gemmataceae bacterium]|nr:hypothetical protein [Gemmataceae bacterium]MCI0737982.1 hypothetical protein [Gemmataceae bacterium]
MAKRTIEPLLWTLFSAGGVVAALFIPIQLLLFGIVFPLGWAETPSHERMLGLLGHPLTRIYLFVLCSMALLHAAHRFRFTLYDGLQIKHLNELINLFCYGGALVLSIWTLVLLWHMP